MSITRCLGRIEKAGIGLPADEKRILLATIERYKADGMEPGAAAIAAVQDALGDARSERAEIDAQIEKQLPASSQTGLVDEKNALRSGDFKELLRLRNERKAAEVKAVGDMSNGGVLTHTGGTRHAMVLPDVDGGGKWRIQRFDKQGFSGHQVFNGQQEALTAALAEGFTKRDDAVLDRLQATPEWDRGMLAADIMQREQSGRGQTAKPSVQELYDELKPGVEAISLDEHIGYLRNEAEKASGAAQPVTMQNRDRSRAASVMQMQGIANAPDPARLSFARDAATGAPMVYAGGDQNNIQESDKGKSDTVTMQGGRKIPVQYAVVEADGVQASNSADGTANQDYSAPLQSGALRALNNGRTAGIQAAHSRGKAGEYVKGISDDAALHGVSAEAIASKKRPMLVRVYSEKDNIGNMGEQSNQAVAQALSPVEQAKTDAMGLPDLTDLVVTDKGDLLDSRNAKLVRKWAISFGGDVGALLDRDDVPNKKAGERLTAALFHKAYLDDALTEAVAEDAKPEIKNILSALTIAAPIFAQVDPAGQFGEYASIIKDAANIVKGSAAAGQNIEEYIRQADAFKVRNESSEEFARYFAKNNRSWRRMGDLLREIARLILSEQKSSASFDMFGRNPLNKADIMRLIARNPDDQSNEDQSNESQPKQQATLFGANPKPLPRAEAATGEQGINEGVSGAVTGQGEQAGRGRAAASDVKPEIKLDRNGNVSADLLKQLGFLRRNSVNGPWQYKSDTMWLETDAYETALDRARGNYEKSLKPAGKAEIRPYRKPDGSVGYEAVPIKAETKSESPAIQDFIDGKRADVPTTDEVKAEQAPKAKTKNTIFTEDAAAAAREVIRAALRQSNAGFNPQLAMAGFTLAGYHIEKGARTFAAYAKAMLDDMGDGIKPYLKGWYTNVSLDPSSANFEGMDDAAYVMSFKDDDIGKDITASKWWDAIGDRKRGNVLAKLGVGNQAANTSWHMLRIESKPKIESYYAGLNTIGEPETQENTEETIEEGNEPTAKDQNALIDFFYKKINAQKMPKDNPALRKLAEEFDGKPVDQLRLKQAQEALEAAISKRSAEIAKQAPMFKDKPTFDRLLDLYSSQPNLNVRTTSSILAQAYSTPSPLAFLAARLAGIDEDTKVYEPSAGNGMLVLTAAPSNVTANELQESRYQALVARGFNTIKGDAMDALKSGKVKAKSQDSVATNPPFGSVKDANGKPIKVKVDGYNIGQIDHLIAAEALKTMKDDGKAVLIIGANKVAGELSTDDRIFFNWLYKHYNVTSQFEVDGKLYSRQGAAWPVRVISINGRALSEKFSPLKGEIKRLDNWKDIYEQYESVLGAQQRKPSGSYSANGVNEQVGANDKVPALRSDGKQAANASGQTNGRTGSKPTGNVERTLPGAVRDGAGATVSKLDSRTDNDKRHDGSADKKNSVGEGARGAVESVATGDSVQKPNAAKPDRSNVSESEFQTSYTPRSATKDELVLVPVNMASPLQNALLQIEDAVGDLDDYVTKELGYSNVEKMQSGLMGLQVDSVAAGIYQIKERNKGIIIADQTGIGKGRQAAAMIRWAAKSGYTPIFITIRPELFTDMYGDLRDIGTSDIQPLILNSEGAIISEDGKKLFANNNRGGKSSIKEAMNGIEKTGKLPEGSNALFLTYSQINTPNQQRRALSALAHNAVFILDESHNAAGESGTGEIVREVLASAKGVVYLSATYAKRPDSMPLYFRTDIGDAITDSSAMMDAMAAGGLPLQTVIANNLVKAGQMFRRERSFAGISIDSMVDVARGSKHAKIADEYTEALRAIVDADKSFHDTGVKALQKLAAEEGGDVSGGGNKAGNSVDHARFSGVVHNSIKQMLLAMKTDTAADAAIAALKRGEKPLIALENTMGSFLNEYAEANSLEQGDELGKFGYQQVLERALARTLFITKKNSQGDKIKVPVALSSLDVGTQIKYQEASKLISKINIDLPVSPIDYMRQRIIDAGFTVSEITGREKAIDYSGKKPVLSLVPLQEQNDKVETTRRFNDGRLDAIILNVSGSTGISLHASSKFKDQRKRQMIMAQAPGDINIFMQMLGRVHRTGQVVLPSYLFVGVDLPAEKRPMAMQSQKMKSLNANTSSNTDSDTSLKSADMLNKYGDQVVKGYLLDNLELAVQLDVLGKMNLPDLARVVTGRMALRPVEEQKEFYDEVESQYNTLIEYLNASNQNELEPKTMDYEAELVEDKTLVEATDANSPFGQEAVYGVYNIKAQGEKMSTPEIKEAIVKSLDGKTAREQANKMYQNLLEKIKEQNAAAEIAGKAQPEYSIDKEFLATNTIGSLVRVELNGDLYNAVITNVRNTHKKGGNPFSLSKMQITLAVNGSLRTITIPGSKWNDIVIAGSQFGSFDRPQWNSNLELHFGNNVEGGQKAKIITGNLLAAYTELKDTKGTIISFTKKDGSTEQGILLPKKFDISENTRNDFQFRSAKDIVKYLLETKDITAARFGLASRDSTVRLMPEGNSIKIVVPKSKAKGGQYFLDKDLIALTGDFVTDGQSMSVDVPRKNMEAVVERILNRAPIYALPSMAADARSILGLPPPPKLETKPQTKFSKAENSGKPGMTRTALLEAIAPIIQNWNTSVAPEVVVVQSTKDLPQSIRDARGFDASVEAAISGNKIYLVADRFSSAARAQEVLAHEAIGHYGIEAILGKEGFAQVAAQVITMRESGAMPELFAEIKARYGNLDDLTFASEAIAVMAEKGVKNTVLGRVMAAVRKFLRDLGFDLQLSETDLRAMIARSARYLQEGDARAPKSAAAQFSKEDLILSNPAFKAFFDGSKVTNSDGSPLIVFHGSPDVRGMFDQGLKSSLRNAFFGAADYQVANSYANEKQAWDYQNSEPGVVPLYLSIKNPMLVDAGGRHWKGTEQYIDRARELGHDGIIIKNSVDFHTNAAGSKPTTVYAWFSPNQAKSALKTDLTTRVVNGSTRKQDVQGTDKIPGATPNNGEFSQTDPRISFSKIESEVRFSRMPPIITNAVAQGDAWLKGFLNAKRKDTVIYNLQDRFIDLKRQIEKIANTGAVIQESENPTLAEDAYAHSRGYRIKQFAETERNPILQKLHDLKIPLKKFEQFLHARHAESRNRVMAGRNPSAAIIAANLSAATQALANLRAANAKTKAINQAIREIKKWRTAQPFKGTEAERLSLSGMSDLEATNFMSGLTPQESAGLAPLGVAVDKINNDTLDLMVEYGLETQDTVDALKAQWEHYIPLHRDEAHPEDGFGLPVGSGFSVSGSGLQQATGSNATVTNIMAHISEAREQMITRGEKNKVSVAIANFIKAHPDPSFAEVGKAETSQKLDDGLVKSFRDPIFMQKSRDNVLMMRVNGKDIPIVFNDKSPENLRLAMALKNLDGSDLDKVESIIGKGTRYFSAINTQYNPIFGIFNLMRDVQGMTLNLTSTPLNGKQGSVMKLMPSAMKVIFDVVRGRSGDPALAKLYHEFNLDGSTTGFSQMFTTVEERTGSIEDEIKAMNSKPIQAWRKFKNALDDFNTIMENSTRFSIYMAALDAGLSRAVASSLAKNTTVNFNRKGAYTTKIGAFYSFFNAAVQGNTRMIQTFAGPAGLKIIAAGVAMGAITALMGIGFMDDEEWEKIPEFVRERSLIFPTGKTSYLAWPLPLGFNLLPNIGRKFVESVFGSEQVSPQRRLLQLAGSVVGTFNPLGGGDLGSTITPTIADPMISLFRNQDWTGKPIYREDLNSLKLTPGFTRTKDTATSAAKWIAEKTNSLTGGTDVRQGLWSPTPDQLDYVMGQLTGGVGREVNKTLQIAEASIKGEQAPFYKIPLLGKFWGSNEGAAAEAQSFYQNVKVMNLHGAEVDSMRESGRSDEASDYLKGNPEARLVKMSEGVYRDVARLRKVIRMLKKGDAPQARIQVLNDVITQKMKLFNDRVSELR